MRVALLRKKRREGASLVVAFKYTAGDSLASWTTSRASSATYYDINGVVQTATSNTMRDGHYLGGVRHWLLEPARTNTFIFNRDFTNAAWTKTACTIGGSTTAADGTTITTNGIIGTNAVNAQSSVVQVGGAATAATNQAVAFKFKPGNKTEFWIDTVRKDGTTNDISFVNASTGAIDSLNANHVIKAWPLSSGWYRFEVRMITSGAGASQVACFAGPCDASGSTQCTGDGATVNGYVDFAQYEADQPWPSSAIATAAASVTRSGDADPTRPHNSTPQSRTLFLDLTVLGGIAQNFPYVQIGTSPNYMGWEGNTLATQTFIARLRNAGTDSSNSPVGNAAVGDRLEIRAAGDATATPAVTAGQSINGAAETTAVGAANANPYQGAYGDVNYHLRASPSGTPLAIRSFKDILGVQSISVCRSA